MTRSVRKIIALQVQLCRPENTDRNVCPKNNFDWKMEMCFSEKMQSLEKVTTSHFSQKNKLPEYILGSLFENS